MNLYVLKRHAYLAASILLVLVFFHPVLIGGKTFFFRDIHRWFYPMKFHLAECLRDGVLPYWCSNTFCGSPFLSDLQSGVFYPLSLVFLLLPFPWSFNLFVVLHFFIGFCFSYLFLKRMGLSSAAALAASLSYCYGGYTLSTVNVLNNLSTLVWLPAVLWSYQRFQEGCRSGFFLTILFLSTALLGGEPQLLMLLVGLLILFSVQPEKDKKAGIRFYIRNLSVVGLVVTWALLITMVQLGPAYTDYSHSVRTEGFSWAEASRFSLEPGTLKHLLVPLSFPFSFATEPELLKAFFPGTDEVPWLLTLYPGILIVPASILGVILGFSRRLLFWTVLFVVGLIMALGHHTPAYALFYKAFPGFRFPPKFVFLLHFSLTVLAAHGFHHSFNRLKGIKVRPWIPVCGVILILFLDLFLAHRHLNPLWESSSFEQYDPSLEPVLKDAETFRVYVDPEIASTPSILDRHKRWQSFLLPNLGILHHVHQVDGVTGLELRYQYLITELLQKPWSEKIRFLRMANVKYIVTTQPLDEMPQLGAQVRRINAFLFQVTDPLPRAWLVGQLLPVKRGTTDELIDVAFDAFSSALGKEDLSEKYRTPFHGKVGWVNYEKQGTVRIRVNAEQPAILVLSESAYPGWQVFVNGKEREVLWLDLLFQGVEIQDGTSDILFRYRPERFSLYVLISCLSCLLFVLAWMGDRIVPSHRRLKTPGPGAESMAEGRH